MSETVFESKTIRCLEHELALIDVQRWVPTRGLGIGTIGAKKCYPIFANNWEATGVKTVGQLQAYALVVRQRCWVCEIISRCNR